MNSQNSFSWELYQRIALLPGIKKLVNHPIDGSKDTIYRTIYDLNDTHYWTREQIADWLDTLDEQPRFV